MSAATETTIADRSPASDAEKSAALPSRIIAGFALVSLLALGACAGQPQSGEERNNIFPADYRTELTVFFKKNPEFGDVKDVLVSEPALKPVGSVNRYVVCVRFKGTPGNPPVIAKDQIAIFFSGSVNQLIDAGREHCGAAAYTPLFTP